MEFFIERGYTITSPFGKRIDPITKQISFHTGVDMVKSHKASIFAFVSGRVVWAKEGLKGSGYGGYGNVVAIKDSNNYTHVYAHLDSIQIDEGKEVHQGQELGRQGTTGRSTGSHLHYEIRERGWNTHIDPLMYLDNYFRHEKKRQEVIEEMSKYFKDIPRDHWGVNHIDRLYEKGII